MGIVAPSVCPGGTATTYACRVCAAGIWLGEKTANRYGVREPEAGSVTGFACR